MSGHGHVTPNADGTLARCGGPALCPECALELARLLTDEVRYEVRDRLGNLLHETTDENEARGVYATHSATHAVALLRVARVVLRRSVALSDIARHAG